MDTLFKVVKLLALLPIALLIIAINGVCALVGGVVKAVDAALDGVMSVIWALMCGIGECGRIFIKEIQWPFRAAFGN